MSRFWAISNQTWAVGNRISLTGENTGPLGFLIKAEKDRLEQIREFLEMSNPKRKLKLFTMKSKTSDEVTVIRTSFERGKLRTFVDESEWRFPRLMKVLEFYDFFLFNNYQLDFLIKDKRIVAVVFPDNVIRKSLT